MSDQRANKLHRWLIVIIATDIDQPAGKLRSALRTGPAAEGLWNQIGSAAVQGSASHGEIVSSPEIYMSCLSFARLTAVAVVCRLALNDSNAANRKELVDKGGEHASTAANPQSVVSLKDTETEPGWFRGSETNPRRNLPNSPIPANG